MDHLIETELNELELLVTRLQRGELSPTEFRALSVHYGVYTQRQPGTFFVRLRLPCGIITNEQLGVLGAALNTRGPGVCQLTTRQGVEVHDLSADQIVRFLRLLAAAGINSHETGGSSVRSVMVCAHAGAGKDEPFDVTPYAALLTDLFVRHPDFQKLPRKMKIGFSCCGDDCARSTLQDLGFQACVTQTGAHGFRVLVGGGTGALPRLGRQMLAFLPAAELAGFVEAFLRMFDRLGDRKNRNHARVKFLVQDLGLERLTDEVVKEWAETRDKSYPGFQVPQGGEAQSSDSNMIAVRIGTNGVTGRQLVQLSALARRFGLAVRTTPDQGFLLRGAPNEGLPEIYKLLEAAGFSRQGPEMQLVTCRGSSACSNAFTNAPGLARAVESKLGTIAGAERITRNLRLRISGCTNGCGMHAVADIGLEGLARRNGNNWEPAYRVRVGGRESQQRPKFGADLGLVPARQVPDCVADLVNYYGANRQPTESFADLLERLGPDDVIAIANKHQKPMATQEIAIDWGDTEPFQPRMTRAAGTC